MAEQCQCGRPLGSPAGPHWWPDRDPEPGPEVQVVVRHGDDLAFLRMLRLPVGWYRYEAPIGPHTTVPYYELVRSWTGIGRCWAGAQHAVVDATSWPGADDADLLGPVIHAWWASFRADLGERLDTEAGLRAILATHPVPAKPRRDGIPEPRRTT